MLPAPSALFFNKLCTLHRSIAWEQVPLPHPDDPMQRTRLIAFGLPLALMLAACTTPGPSDPFAPAASAGLAALISTEDEDGDGYCDDDTSCTDGSLPGDCDDEDVKSYPDAPERARGQGSTTSQAPSASASAHTDGLASSQSARGSPVTQPARPSPSRSSGPGQRSRGSTTPSLSASSEVPERRSLQSTRCERSPPLSALR
jgi:hypothetical protein